MNVPLGQIESFLRHMNRCSPVSFRARFEESGSHLYDRTSGRVQRFGQMHLGIALFSLLFF
jgi:hypothetical protein